MNRTDRFVIGSTLKLIIEFLLLIIMHKAGIKTIEREDAEMAAGMGQGVSSNLGRWVYEGDGDGS